MTALDDLVESNVPRAQRRNHAAVQRLVGMLDLDPPLDPGAMKDAVEEELKDQRARAIAALTDEKVARAARDVVGATPRGFPRDALAALSRDAPPQTADALDEIVARYDRFDERVRWLLRPSTFDEVQALDPIRDCDRIYHFVSYEFRLEQKLYAILFELAPLMIPYSALMIASTGELSRRGFKRLTDTVMFFSNMIEWGLDSKRGRRAIERVNEIHGRYSLPNELFRFILGGVMFLPIEYNDALGWRRFTDVERLGWFHTFVAMGRAMHIRGMTDDFDEMRAWYTDLRARAGETSRVGSRSFREAMVQILAPYPVDLRRALLSAVFCGMPDAVRETLEVPPPPDHVMTAVRQTLSSIGRLTSLLPRVPWVRSLQLHPLYRRIDDIGVHARSELLPRRVSVPMTGATRGARLGDARADNGGYPVGQCPVASTADIRPIAWAAISKDEVARHARDDDAWIAIRGYVYDVTRFLADHPGGRDVLAPHFGGDATDAFLKVGHSSGALVMMANFRIGRLSGEDPAELLDHGGPSAAGGQIHTGRRTGARRPSEPDAWNRLLGEIEEQTRRYELAKQNPSPKSESSAHDADNGPVTPISLSGSGEGHTGS